MTATFRQRIHSAVWLPGGSDDAPPLLRPRFVLPLLAFVAFAFGLNWPLASIGLRSISPLWMLALRLVGATITLFVVMTVSGRIALPPRRDYPIVLSVALVKLALVFLLVFVALETVPPGRSSILVWTASLWTVPMAVVLVGERMSPVRWLGLTIGIAGILMVFEPTRLDWTDGRVIVGHLMLIGAAMLNAAVSVHVRHHSWVATPLDLLPWQALVAAVPVLAIALATEGVPTIAWTPGLVAIVTYQGLIASSLAMWAQITVLRAHSAIATNLALMAIPVIGLTSSAIIVDEVLTAGVVAGLTLVLAGVAASLVADARAPAGAPD